MKDNLTQKTERDGMRVVLRPAESHSSFSMLLVSAENGVFVEARVYIDFEN